MTDEEIQELQIKDQVRSYLSHLFRPTSILVIICSFAIGYGTWSYTDLHLAKMENRNSEAMVALKDKQLENLREIKQRTEKFLQKMDTLSSKLSENARSRTEYLINELQKELRSLHGQSVGIEAILEQARATQKGMGTITNQLISTLEISKEIETDIKAELDSIQRLMENANAATSAATNSSERILQLGKLLATNRTVVDEVRRATARGIDELRVEVHTLRTNVNENSRLTSQIEFNRLKTRTVASIDDTATIGEVARSPQIKWRMQGPLSKPTPVPGADIEIGTKGGAIMIGFVSSVNDPESYIGGTAGRSAWPFSITMRLYRDGTNAVAAHRYRGMESGNIPSSSVMFMDANAAPGVHQYNVKVEFETVDGFIVVNGQMIAFEL